TRQTPQRGCGVPRPASRNGYAQRPKIAGATAALAGKEFGDRQGGGDSRLHRDAQPAATESLDVGHPDAGSFHTPVQRRDPGDGGYRWGVKIQREPSNHRSLGSGSGGTAEPALRGG